MISQAEWEQWRLNEATKKLLDILKVGRDMAVEELIGNRGQVSDIHRGAILAYDEISEAIKTGEFFIKE